MAKAKAKTKTKASPTDEILKELRAFGLAYPGAHYKSPWPGHLDLAVNDKTFAYLSLEGEPLGISCKLPQSAAMALMLPGAAPAAYGLGKSGWVAVTFETADVDVGMLKAWIDESYRAQAPKRLIAQIGAAAAAAKPAAAKPAAKPSAVKQPAAKTPAARTPAAKQPAAKQAAATTKPRASKRG